jgi:hypothetical protein
MREKLVAWMEWHKLSSVAEVRGRASLKSGTALETFCLDDHSRMLRTEACTESCGVAQSTAARER